MLNLKTNQYPTNLLQQNSAKQEQSQNGLLCQKDQQNENQKRESIKNPYQLRSQLCEVPSPIGSTAINASSSFSTTYLSIEQPRFIKKSQKSVSPSNRRSFEHVKEINGSVLEEQKKNLQLKCNILKKLAMDKRQSVGHCFETKKLQNLRESQIHLREGRKSLEENMNISSNLQTENSILNSNNIGPYKNYSVINNNNTSNMSSVYLNNRDANHFSQQNISNISQQNSLSKTYVQNQQQQQQSQQKYFDINKMYYYNEGMALGNNQTDITDSTISNNPINSCSIQQHMDPISQLAIQDLQEETKQPVNSVVIEKLNFYKKSLTQEFNANSQLLTSERKQHLKNSISSQRDNTQHNTIKQKTQTCQNIIPQNHKNEKSSYYQLGQNRKSSQDKKQQNIEKVQKNLHNVGADQKIKQSTNENGIGINNVNNLNKNKQQKYSHTDIGKMTLKQQAYPLHSTYQTSQKNIQKLSSPQSQTSLKNINVELFRLKADSYDKNEQSNEVKLKPSHFSKKPSNIPSPNKKPYLLDNLFEQNCFSDHIQEFNNVLTNENNIQQQIDFPTIQDEMQGRNNKNDFEINEILNLGQQKQNEIQITPQEDICAENIQHIKPQIDKLDIQKVQRKKSSELSIKKGQPQQTIVLELNSKRGSLNKNNNNNNNNQDQGQIQTSRDSCTSEKVPIKKDTPTIKNEILYLKAQQGSSPKRCVQKSSTNKQNQQQFRYPTPTKTKETPKIGVEAISLKQQNILPNNAHFQKNQVLKDQKQQKKKNQKPLHKSPSPKQKQVSRSPIRNKLQQQQSDSQQLSKIAQSSQNYNKRLSDITKNQQIIQQQKQLGNLGVSSSPNKQISENLIRNEEYNVKMLQQHQQQKDIIQQGSQKPKHQKNNPTYDISEKKMPLSSQSNIQKEKRSKSNANDLIQQNPLKLNIRKQSVGQNIRQAKLLGEIDLPKQIADSKINGKYQKYCQDALFHYKQKYKMANILQDISDLDINNQSDPSQQQRKPLSKSVQQKQEILQDENSPLTKIKLGTNNIEDSSLIEEQESIIYSSPTNQVEEINAVDNREENQQKQFENMIPITNCVSNDTRKKSESEKIVQQQLKKVIQQRDDQNKQDEDSNNVRHDDILKNLNYRLKQLEEQKKKSTNNRHSMGVSFNTKTQKVIEKETGNLQTASARMCQSNNYLGQSSRTLKKQQSMIQTSSFGQQTSQKIQNNLACSKGSVSCKNQKIKSNPQIKQQSAKTIATNGSCSKTKDEITLQNLLKETTNILKKRKLLGRTTALDKLIKDVLQQDPKEKELQELVQMLKNSHLPANENSGTKKTNLISSNKKIKTEQQINGIEKVQKKENEKTTKQSQKQETEELILQEKQINTINPLDFRQIQQQQQNCEQQLEQDNEKDSHINNQLMANPHSPKNLYKMTNQNEEMNNSGKQKIRLVQSFVSNSSNIFTSQKVTDYKQFVKGGEDEEDSKIRFSQILDLDTSPAYKNFEDIYKQFISEEEDQLQ